MNLDRLDEVEFEGGAFCVAGDQVTDTGQVVGKPVVIEAFLKAAGPNSATAESHRRAFIALVNIQMTLRAHRTAGGSACRQGGRGKEKQRQCEDFQFTSLTKYRPRFAMFHRVDRLRAHARIVSSETSPVHQQDPSIVAFRSADAGGSSVRRDPVYR